MEYSPCGVQKQFTKKRANVLGEVSNSNIINSVYVSHVEPSVIQPKISRLSSFFECLSLGRHHWRLIIAMLSIFHVTEGYVTVSMNGICKLNGLKSLRLSPEAAISLLLDTPGVVRSGCRVELIAPETHSISLLFLRRKSFDEKKTDFSSNEKSRAPKCPIIVSFPLLRSEEVKMCLDLCSEDAFKSVEHFTDLLPSRMILEWIPNVKNSNEILASKIVVAAVGRGFFPVYCSKGREICSRPNQFACRSVGYPIYCIDKKLMCDGKRNCPFEGRDEDRDLCSSEGNLDKVGFGLKENSRIGGGWEFLASEFLKKLSSRENSQFKKFDLTPSTEKSIVLWPDEGGIHSRGSESLPNVLKHYGPWGYLMLGMLICGTVLMFCGLWECCCRRPKALVSNTVGPALLIINQGAQQTELDTPSTPGPPRYEELDQPPSYSVLFPSSKPSDVQSLASQTNSLPIALPVMHSLTIMRNGSSLINASSNPLNDRNCSVHNTDIFTIDLQNSNCLDISTDFCENEASAK